MSRVGVDLALRAAEVARTRNIALAIEMEDDDEEMLHGLHAGMFRVRMDRAWPRVGAENPVTSCDLHVLVYEAAEPVWSQWPNCRVAAWGSAACRRLLSERPVWAMKVVVLGELTQHCCEVARSGDQEVVEALPAQGADEAFRDRVIVGRVLCRRSRLTSWRSTRIDLVAQHQDLDVLDRLGTCEQRQPAQRAGEHQVREPKGPW